MSEMINNMVADLLDAHEVGGALKLLCDIGTPTATVLPYVLEFDELLKDQAIKLIVLGDLMDAEIETYFSFQLAAIIEDNSKLLSSLLPPETTIEA